jgi:hypothetical protein
VRRTLETCTRLSEELNARERQKKCGTFFDSKEDMVKLYVLFTLCGIATTAENVNNSISNG